MLVKQSLQLVMVTCNACCLEKLKAGEQLLGLIWPDKPYEVQREDIGWWMQYGFEQDAPRRSLTGEFKCTLESSTNFRVGSNELRVSTAGRYLRQADAPLHYQRFRKRPHCGWSYSCQMSNCYSMRVAIFLLWYEYTTINHSYVCSREHHIHSLMNPNTFRAI